MQNFERFYTILARNNTVLRSRPSCFMDGLYSPQNRLIFRRKLNLFDIVELDKTVGLKNKLNRIEMGFDLALIALTKLYFDTEER